MGVSGGYFSREGSNQTRQIYPMDRGGKMMGAERREAILRDARFMRAPQDEDGVRGSSFNGHRRQSSLILRRPLEAVVSKDEACAQAAAGKPSAMALPHVRDAKQRARRHHRHHAILPVFCPTSQILFLYFRTR
ncbi:hypothetical protein [Bradyrhizobium cajani]|uniref:Uncharacterized protein n=1 Tax=Bradyrhizobium cajani TaxID=1928661 RepID=A0A844TBP3_9BRAD|nr:hypothetical protein [Bradyrhizobium cajani]MCP3373454.1 hypothetical protein [Bradyrhizobium cajani]MVT72030.1 hypothetical protein [Bradyrhizobium cajani]